MNKEKNKKKSQILNIIFLIIIALIFFTPVKKPIVTVVGKIQSLFSPSINEDTNREKLNSYDWQMVDQNGEVFNLNQTVGKVTFINQWATWCPPCIAEMPAIQKLYNKYKNNPDIIFIFVTNDPAEKVSKFMTDNNYDLPVYFMSSTAPQQLASKTIPMTFLIDKKGEIAIKKKGAANWNSKGVNKTINQLLKE